MHEISLVRKIFRILEEEFPAEIDRIRGIHLSVGILSNVQPVLMQTAFAAVLPEETRYAKSSLYVEVLPVLIHCEDCDKTTEIKNFRFVCACGRPCRNIIQGEELQISRVDFSDE